jgi:hypothetical protein
MLANMLLSRAAAAVATVLVVLVVLVVIVPALRAKILVAGHRLKHR